MVSPISLERVSNSGFQDIDLARPSEPLGSRQISVGDRTAVDVTSYLVNVWKRRYSIDFRCQWQSPTHSGARSSLRVGYCGGGHASFLEVFEDALEVSRILGGPTVDGLYVRKGSPFGLWLRLFPAKSLLRNWDSFFERHHSGNYVQYISGVSSSGLDQVLESYPHKDRVLVIAIDCMTTPNHEQALCFRSTGSWYGDPSALLLTRSSEAKGLFFIKSSDPSFYGALKLGFAFAAGQPSVPMLPLRAIAESLQANPDVLSQTPACEPLILYYDANLLASLQEIENSYKETLAGRDRWSDFTFARLSLLIASCIRIVDYTLMLAGACNRLCAGTTANTTTVVTTACSQSSSVSFTSSAVNNTTMSKTTVSYSTPIASSSTFTSSANTSTSVVSSLSTSASGVTTSCTSSPITTDSLLFCSWLAVGICQGILMLCEYGRYHKIRYVLMIFNNFTPVITMLDLSWNLFLAEGNNCVLHKALGIYGATYFARAAISVASPWLRQEMHYISGVATNWRQVGKNVKSNSLVKVNNAYRGTMRKIRAFHETLYLVLLGALFYAGHLFCSTKCITGDVIHGLYLAVMILILISQITLHSSQ